MDETFILTLALANLVFETLYIVHQTEIYSGISLIYIEVHLNCVLLKQFEFSSIATNIFDLPVDNFTFSF